MPSRYGCFATGLMRAPIELPLDSGLPLQQGDRLEVVGEKDNLQRLAESIGFIHQHLASGEPGATGTDIQLEPVMFERGRAAAPKQLLSPGIA